MALTCEICGSPIRTTPNRIKIDGAALLVCQRCAGRRSPKSQPAAVPVPFGVRPRTHNTFEEPELEIDPDYGSIVKRARENMGLTQEDLGRAMNIKPSVISHVESARMKPDIILARRLMHYLKINLLVPRSELETTQRDFT